MKDKFQQIIDKYTIIRDKYILRHNIVGGIKLLLATLIVVSIYYFFASKQYVLVGIGMGILVFIYIIMMFYQLSLKRIVKHAKSMITINERHIARIDGTWAKFQDIGKEFIDYDHPYAFDLDIVGQKSIFQQLNATHTYFGRTAFASDLLTTTYTNEQILERQDAINELADKLTFTNELEANTLYISKADYVVGLINTLSDKGQFIKSKIIKNILMVLPYILLACTFVLSVFGIVEGSLPLQVVALLNGAILAIFTLKSNAYLSELATLPHKLTSYVDVITTIKKENFTSKRLIELQKELDVAHIAIKQLNALSARLQIRTNPIVYLAMNITLLFDIQTAIRLETWKKKYGSQVEGWFEAIGEIESLYSFSILKNVCTTTVLPTISKNKKQIQVSDMGHPLILNEQRVVNSTNLNDQIFIVSGSNMSGKTTFLRTIGINMILAKTGSFVCATKFSFYPLTIMTSMRIVDDLNEGISTFYAELKRIKGIIDEASSNSDVLFLIDEIFRGTNSIDRLSGAKEVLQNLDNKQLIGMITTHDLDLCKLEENSSRIKNYSFNESYHENEILFDYKLQSGKSITTNAKFLMQVLGIIQK